METENGQKKPSLESLNQQLDAMKKLAPESTTRPAGTPPGDAARAAIDFASATAVGSALGFGVDYWLHTSPWGLLVGLLIGTGAGLKMMFALEARDRAKEPTDKKNDNA